MRGTRHHLLSGLGAVWLTASGLAPPAWGATSTADDVDDPKMSRIFQATQPPASPPISNPGAPLPQKAAPRPPAPTPAPAATTRSEVAKPAAPKVEPARPVPAAVAVEPARPAPAAAAVAVAPAAVSAEPIAVSVAKPVAPPVLDRGENSNAPSVDVAAREERSERVAPAPAGREWPYAPRLKLAYRRFPFLRAGAPTGTTTTPTSISESFESVSIDVYPMSSFLRVGLSTQFGWESDKFDRSGDYFIAESASVGFQWPGRITPFVEGLAGAGYMRRAAADWNLPTAYWQVGVDAGIEVYLAKRAYVSLAVGYLHPGNLFLRDQSLMSVKSDSWSLKFGVGI